MLDFSAISLSYPEPIRGFKRNILREYLQYKILDIVFSSEWGARLCFLGGTALRIVHASQRFSEDLDFDHFGLDEAAFEQVGKYVQERLEKEGFQIELRFVHKGAYRCFIRFPRLLFEQGLSPYQEEKILIQLDTVAQFFEYKPEQVILNRFEVFTRILSTPLDLLLSQKIYAILNRKRAKGRDFFDFIFLWPKTLPNYAYLKQKTGISNKKELLSRLSQLCVELDFRQLSNDVKPFLFETKASQKVLLFPDYIAQLSAGF